MANQNPVFQPIRKRHKGRPVIEILKNGEPFWEDLPGAKGHFTFGVRKALMILSCIQLIKEFADSDGRQPMLDDRGISVASDKWGAQCTVHRFEGFKQRGMWVERPYLTISGIPIGGDKKAISFGVTKAKALCELEGAVQSFVMENYL